MHIGGVCIFEGAIPFERFVATIESKLDSIPRYREKAVFPFLNIGFPTWQSDTGISISCRHIFHVTLEAPGSDEQLRELTGRIYPVCSTAISRFGRPMWWTVWPADGRR